MPYKIVNLKKSNSKLTALIIVGVAILVAGSGAYWWSYGRKPATEVITRAGNLSTSSPANSANASPAKKQPSSNTQRTIAGGTDTKGQTTANTNSSQWVASKSGNITVEQPLADATIRGGTVLSGTAKVGTVNFRLIDNSVGVISEGTLSVVNGKFSGKLNFTPHSSGGQLDVFSTGSNGVELNEVQIAVKF